MTFLTGSRVENKGAERSGPAGINFLVTAGISIRGLCSTGRTGHQFRYNPAWERNTSSITKKFYGGHLCRPVLILGEVATEPGLLISMARRVQVVVLSTESQKPKVPEQLVRRATQGLWLAGVVIELDRSKGKIDMQPKMVLLNL